MGILHTKINSRITCLKQEYQNNKDVPHKGIKGSFNESELSELIKKVIPTRYIVTKGIVENSKDEQSNETDIIIYDNDILPRYVKNDLSFIPIEAVKYVFEVKSSLNATELKTTIDKFYNYKKMGEIYTCRQFPVLVNLPVQQKAEIDVRIDLGANQHVLRIG
jgi:hypothetical protein